MDKHWNTLLTETKGRKSEKRLKVRFRIEQIYEQLLIDKTCVQTTILQSTIMVQYKEIYCR